MGLQILSGEKGHLERSYEAEISSRGSRLVHKSPKGKFQGGLVERHYLGDWATKAEQHVFSM